MENSISIEAGMISLRFRKISIFTTALVLLWVPALLAQRSIEEAVSLPVTVSSNLYFLPQYAGLLYFTAPLVVISTLILFLSPGLLLTLAFDKAKSAGQWLVYGLTTSIILISFSTAALQGWLNFQLRGVNFGIVVALVAAVCFGFLYLQVLRGRDIHLPADSALTFSLSILVIWMLAAALAPKFYWENFNGDGAHAYEAARLLLFQPFPFWDGSSGNVATFPGITSMLFTYPISWFIRFFGEFEASSRLPYLLFLVCAFGIILSLIEQGQNRRLGLIEQSLIWLSLVIYTIAVAYSATYNPYSADIALPATQDTLTVVCYLGFVLAFLSNDTRWMVLFLLLTLFSLPNGILLAGIWIVSVVLVFRPVPWRRLSIVAAGIFLFFGLSFAIPRLMSLFNLPFSKGEYGLINILSRFAFLQLTDFRRILFVVVPAGILPAISLAFWKRQDQVSKALTLLILIYFGFFYFQAYTALHYFIPVMLIPLVVLWRTTNYFTKRAKRWTYVAAAIAGIGAIILSLPATFTIDTSGKIVGATIENRIQGYDTHNPAVFRSLSLLASLFPYDWDPAVPLNSYGGAALVWNYYSHQNKDPQSQVNYVIQDIHDQPPEKMGLFASNSEFALYIKDATVLSAQRAIRPETPAGSRLYAIPRSFLFRSITDPDEPEIVDVIEVLQGFGFDLTPVLQKFGVEGSY